MKHPIIDKKVFEEYQESEKRKTLFLLKSFTIFLLFTNIIFTFFLVTYSLHLSDTKTSNISSSSSLSQMQSLYKLQESKTQHMLVNIFSTINTSFNSLTDIIHSIDEYNQIMSYSNIDGRISSYICYQGSLDGDTYKGYHNYCGFYKDQIILIELVDGTRIGAYLSNVPYSDSEDGGDVVVDDENAVVFNVDSGVVYKVNDPKGVFTVYKEGFFKIGRNDIYIVNGYMGNEGSLSEFPGQFGSEDVEKYKLTNGQRELKVSQMEVFALWNEDDEDFF